MKFIIFIGLLAIGLTNVVIANDSNVQAFEIPRTTVVEVIDYSTGRSYPLFIKLPKSYRKNNHKNYPVIYLTDAWYAFQIVSGATRYPMNVNKMQQAIIVGISYQKGSKLDNSRVYDYTPTKVKSWRKSKI